MQKIVIFLVLYFSMFTHFLIRSLTIIPLFQIREAIMEKLPKQLRRKRESISDISLETQRRISIGHTSVTDFWKIDHNGSIMTTKV